MKKIYFLVLTLCFFNGLYAQNIIIPDFNLKMKLISLNVDINSNSEIEISEALKITFLDLSNSNITSLEGLDSFTNLEFLDCSNNPLLRDIDFNKLKKLVHLRYSNIQSKEYLQIENLPELTTILADGLTNLKFVQCTGNPKLTTLSLNGAANLTEIVATNNKLTTLNLLGVVQLKKLRCSSNQLAALDMSSLTKLESLSCEDNRLKSTEFNVADLVKLKYLSCQNNQLVKLNTDFLWDLVYLNCSSNEIIDLHVSNMYNLEELYCDGNNISSLKLGASRKLQWLNCSNNRFTDLNVRDLTQLKGVSCSNNEITSLDLNGLINLENLQCFNNQIKTLDLSDLKSLARLDCSQNQLTSLLIRNGSKEAGFLNFSANPNLQYVCADENQLEQVKALVTTYGYTNCNVNAYCSFKPVGTYFTVQGNSKIDSDKNGCDAQDLGFPNLKFNLSDGTNTGSIIANATGSYSISLPTGTHSITPVLENPEYFSIWPTSINATFPAQSSPVTQNFCITAKGTHSDLEVTLLPINVARPGFEAQYKIVYKNKGNNVQSGSVNLNFNDSVLDFVSANPVVSNQASNNLFWNFTNLRPFESKEIIFTVKVNAPTATPAVNNGDILSFVATIQTLSTDDTPNDNTFTLNQIVVGSYDPNDKTCLEGSVITPNLIGEYVHYMIRFENTGTYQAQNIVVKDMIDLAKFDIATLAPTSSSHPFVTNITEGNKVEFIFENINLPFDDANNDGYIAFKIKTKSTLKVGDSFTNDANIYFDYNFPILTNKATSTFQTTLGTPDFEFSNYFALFPVPANEVLNITSRKDIEVQSIAIYDVLGQLVIAVPNAKSVSNIDVANLKTGNYFIKVKSDKGSSSTKFIKK
ncbi:leucine-rich repeat domain-containing protein [Flavobacterium sp. 140616W15]|uniref:DUF7619 domain-containing protein n=1 Tax=Flavobacterium sp. 140616W15 TaxID=2478552 RepID=UPI000F0C2DEB|nr:leucine-rich repeat domain-containing protein [Flavobacterium sp. 140616W15]AYN03351.1 T9SS C-terminal target domain-containing protein [Flavobacterium sp. 140616W15]